VFLLSKDNKNYWVSSKSLTIELSSTKYKSKVRWGWRRSRPVQPRILKMVGIGEWGKLTATFSRVKLYSKFLSLLRSVGSTGVDGNLITWCLYGCPYRERDIRLKRRCWIVKQNLVSEMTGNAVRILNFLLNLLSKFCRSSIYCLFSSPDII